MREVERGHNFVSINLNDQPGEKHWKFSKFAPALACLVLLLSDKAGISSSSSYVRLVCSQ